MHPKIWKNWKLHRCLTILFHYKDIKYLLSHIPTDKHTPTHTFKHIYGTCSLVKCCHFSKISWSRSQRSSVQRQMAAQRSPNTWTHVYTLLIRGFTLISFWAGSKTFDRWQDRNFSFFRCDLCSNLWTELVLQTGYTLKPNIQGHSCLSYMSCIIFTQSFI